MTRSSPWLAPVLTLLTLAGTLGAALDANHRTAFALGTGIVVAGSMALFVGQRLLRRDLDWRLAAPLLVGVTALNALTADGLESSVAFAVVAVIAYFFAARERRIATAAEGTSSASLLLIAALLSFFAAIGGALIAPAWLFATTIWLLVWMPSRTRHIRDQDTFRLARGPGEVSAYLLDQRHLPLWYPSSASSELLDGHDLGLGATFRQVVEIRGRPKEALVMVDEYEPGRRLCTHVMEVPGRGSSCYSFSPNVGGTAATYTYEGEQPYPAALIGSMFFIGGALRKVRAQRHEAFEKLKSILEA
jgi:Polyketide cyclase / dehydrase and lipid transport